MLKVVPGEKTKSDEALTREFARHARKSGLVSEIRGRKSFTKSPSKNVRRVEAQKRTKAQRQYDHLVKIGRISPR